MRFLVAPGEEVRSTLVKAIAHSLQMVEISPTIWERSLVGNFQQLLQSQQQRAWIRSNTVYDHYRYTKDVQMLLKGAVLMPDYAIIDPQFTMTMTTKVAHGSNRIRCTDTCSRSVYIQLPTAII